MEAPEEELEDYDKYTVVRCGRFCEYKSKANILGLPLYHYVNWPLKPGTPGVVVAKGVFAHGVISMGVFCLGFFSLGVVTVACISFGLAAALGNVAVSAVAALGNVAVTIGFALGNVAIGYRVLAGIAVQYGPRP